MIKTIKLENGDTVVINWNAIGHLAGWIDSLYKISKELPECGVLSSMVLDHNDKIYSLGGFLTPNLNYPLSYAMGETYYGQYGGTRAVPITRLICAIIKKELIDKIGLPENIGDNPFIDADYCLEAGLAGFKVYVTPEIKVQYKGDISDYTSLQDYAEQGEKDYNAFNEKWKDKLPKNDKTPVLYQTSVFQPSGFAMAARGYIKGLTDLGVRVAYNYLKGTNEEEPEAEDEVINSICEYHGDKHMPQVIWAQAPYFNKNSGDYKIGHCEFEGDSVPESWVPECNNMDELWVPTEWDRHKFRVAGVSVPVFVIPQGIDANYFHPEMAPMKYETDKGFKFLCNAAWDPRKNIPNLIKAFQMEFSLEEDVCLIIKTMNMGLVEDINKAVEEIRQDPKGAKVHVVEAGLKQEELGTMYTGADCFVLPTHGEAWGLPLIEALACGIPVITTGWGAPDEILRGEDGQPLPGVRFLKYQKALTDTNYTYLQGNYWAEPSIPDLMRAMREAFENKEEQRKQALLGSEIIRQKYTWQKCCEPIKERLEDIYKRENDTKFHRADY